MNLFGKSKPSIKTEKSMNDTKVNIEYFKMKNPASYKLELFKKLIGSGACLAILDTEFMYTEQKRIYRQGLSKLMEKLDEANVQYKQLTVKKKKETVIFGISIKQHDDNDCYDDYVIGFVINSENIEDVKLILSSYNMKYYFLQANCSEQDILSKFEEKFNDEESLRAEFDFKIYDDGFIGSISMIIPNTNQHLIENLEEISRNGR